MLRGIRYQLRSRFGDLYLMSEINALTSQQITFGIIGAYRDVYRALGWGFLESVYLNAMELALKAKNFGVQREAPLHVRFGGQVVGNFRADLIIENSVIVELKAVDRLTGAHEAQLLNYLRASGLTIGLLFNFGMKFEQRRLVWTPNEQRLS